ncbi:hypothetical protein ACSILQ_001618 [Yersinia enterocolitica]
MGVIKFRELCDDTISQSTFTERDTDEAYSLIYDLCIDHIDEVSRKSGVLIKHIIFESILNDTSSTPYVSILQLINDAARYKEPQNKTSQSFSSQQFDKWQELIVIAFSTKDKSSFFKEDKICSSFNKIIEFSKSCKNLSKYGVDFEYYKDKIIIKKESYDVVLKIIDNYINNIGGVLILDYSFKILTNYFEPTQERFQIYRKTTQGLDYILPETPWGYIIALGAKNLHTNQKIPHKKTIDEYRSFIRFMTDIVSSFEIQPYVIWESIYVDNLNAVEFLQENILYDNLISFFQLKSTHAIEMISNISTYWKYEKIQSFGLDFDDIIKTGISIIQLSHAQNISLISKSKISKRSGLKLNVTDKIIDKIYTSKNNNELGFPPSSEAIDHVLAPLIPHKGMYIALPKGITSLSVLNCILNQVSRPNGVFVNSKDSSVGKFLEQFVWNQVNQHGIKCYRGDFKSKDKKIKGDCDLLIKTDDYIYLFEIKKKSLTRKAMSGTDFKIIQDLADSLMRSQSQCAKIEYVLLADKEITLTINDKNEIIPYNNERIFKISLSLHDFGALQDTTILSTILGLAMQVQFSADSDEVNKMISSWKNYVDIFSDYTEKSRKLQPVRDDLFRNNIFMSIPQLLTILGDSHDENEFSDLCKGSQHMTYSTRCFYKEYTLRKVLYKR